MKIFDLVMSSGTIGSFLLSHLAAILLLTFSAFIPIHGRTSISKLISLIGKTQVGTSSSIPSLARGKSSKFVHLSSREQEVGLALEVDIEGLPGAQPFLLMDAILHWPIQRVVHRKLSINANLIKHYL